MPSGASAPSRNLLGTPWVRALLKSRWFPAIFAYPTLVVFSYIVYALLFGPGAASANLGTTLTWVLWWPLIPLLMFALGRFWCAICPFATVIDLVQKLAGLGRPVTPFLKRYGIWIIDATFILITWADHVFGIVESPRGSGYLLAMLVTASVVTAVFYHVTGSAELVSPGTVTMLQFVIVGLGIAGSVYTATRIAQRSGSTAPPLQALLPHGIVLILFGLVNLYLFTLPMVHRV
jgi:polyferredoxin